jgi:hypothetical protein
MITGVSRRLFVGSVAAGVPLLAGAGLLAQSSSRPTHTHPSADPPSDPMLDHLLAQLAAVHARAARDGLTGEHGRSAAALLRTLGIHLVQSGLDQQLRRGVRTHVARNGRDAVIYANPDTPAMREELRRLGIDADAIPFGRVAPADDAARRRALDRLQREGASARFSQLAAQLQAIAAEIDRRGGPPVIQRAQWGYGGDCSFLATQIGYLEAEVAIVCGAAFLFPALGSVCAVLSVALGLELLYYNYWC